MEHTKPEVGKMMVDHLRMSAKMLRQLRSSLPFPVDQAVRTIGLVTMALEEMLKTASAKWADQAMLDEAEAGDIMSGDRGVLDE
jgi:hypothetical protein